MSETQNHNSYGKPVEMTVIGAGSYGTSLAISWRAMARISSCGDMMQSIWRALTLTALTMNFCPELLFLTL